MVFLNFQLEPGLLNSQHENSSNQHTFTGESAFINIEEIEAITQHDQSVLLRMRSGHPLRIKGTTEEVMAYIRSHTTAGGHTREAYERRHQAKYQHQEN